MRRMLEDLLWLARFDASKKSPDVEPVDLAVMAAQAVDRFGAIAETRHLAIDLAVPPDGARVALTVDDSGPGIPETERTRIFDRFHRATDSHGGAGLGLAIADAIVRATGGRWKVASAPDGGARMGVSWSRALA